MITSKDILDELGLKNIKTLTRWYKEYKLVPPPTIKTHPNGRGRIAYWEESELPLFRYVKSKFDEGLKADEIKASLRLRGVEEHNKFLNHVEAINAFVDDLIDGFRDDPRKLFYNIYEETLSALSKSDIGAKKQQKIYNFLIDKDTLFKVLWYLDSGYNPVLFIAGSKYYILIDCIISDLLSEQEFKDICFVFPLKNSVVSFVQKVTDGKINYKVDKFPIRGIELKKEDGRILQVPYVNMSPELGGFELIRECTKVVWEGDEGKNSNEE